MISCDSVEVARPYTNVLAVVGFSFLPCVGQVLKSGRNASPVE